MNTLEVLKAGRKLISDPRKWTQDTYARDSDGLCVSGEDAAAVCFCSIGAVQHVTGKCHNIETEKVCEILSEAAGMHIAYYNDKHSHEDVLAVWDRAIAAKEAEESRTGL